MSSASSPLGPTRSAGSPSDPRSQRSRQRLLDAVVDLMGAHEVDDISVTALAHRAGVSRPTVYQHFSDIGALARTAALERLQAAFPREAAPGPPHVDSADPRSWIEAVQVVVLQLLTHLRQNADFYRRALAGSGGRELHGDVISLLVRQLLERSPLGPALRGGGPVDGTRESTAPGSAGGVEPDGYAGDRVTIIASGVVWLIQGWLESGSVTVTGTEEMARRISTALVLLSGVAEQQGR